MDNVSLTETKAHPSKLVDRVVAGESVNIKRCGRLVARLIPATNARKRIDLALLQSLTATMPPAAELIRPMRDDDRY